MCLQLTSRLDASLQMDVLYTSQMGFRGGIHVVTRGIDGIDEVWVSTLLLPPDLIEIGDHLRAGRLIIKRVDSHIHIHIHMDRGWFLRLR